ncbi:MAG: hypothetical protein II943_11645 [Victivallales bacterium]|nr:hypothetical protein [Victivallales bacterium]
MKKTFQITIAMSLLALAFCMTGCEALLGGKKTMSPLAAPVVTTDPKTGAAMPDNDTQILSPAAKTYALKEFRLMAENKNEGKPARLLPSSQIASFIGNNDERQQFIKRLASRIFMAFDDMSDFDMLGNEATVLDEPPAAEGNAVSLVFNVVSMDLINNTKGTCEVTLTFLDADGVERKDYFMSRRVEATGASAMNAIDNLAIAASKELAQEYSRRHTPPVFVTERRGYGQFAKISAGQAYGVQVGNKVAFIEHEEGAVENVFTGEKEDRDTQVGTGKVVEVEQDYAWVLVDNPEQSRAKVKIYTMVKFLAN